jgi:hypothetical protein
MVQKVLLRLRAMLTFTSRHKELLEKRKTGTDHVYPENGREWGQTTFFCVAL